MNIKLFSFLRFFEKKLQPRDKEEKNKINLSIILAFIVFLILQLVFSNWENVKEMFLNSFNS